MTAPFSFPAGPQPLPPLPASNLAAIRAEERTLSHLLAAEIAKHQPPTFRQPDFFARFAPHHTHLLLASAKQLRAHIEHHILPATHTLRHALTAFSHAISALVEHEFARSWFLADALRALGEGEGKARELLGTTDGELEGWYADVGQTEGWKAGMLGAFVGRACAVVGEVVELARGLHPVHLLPGAPRGEGKDDGTGDGCRGLEGVTDQPGPAFNLADTSNVVTAFATF